MKRRSALKSMMAAFTAAFAGGSVAAEAEQTSHVPVRTNTMIETGDGTRLHYRDWGASTDRPVVFVAPWGLSSDWWDAPVICLSQLGWRCVSFDRRGHARSDDPCRGYDFDTLADDIASVMDALDLQDVVLVGHSMGGAEVVRYLTRHNSRRVAHAVLIAPTTPISLTGDIPGGMTRERFERLREGLKHDLPRLAAEAAPGFFGVPKNSVSPETIEWWYRMFLDRVSVKVLSDLFTMMNEADFRAELRTIRTPTLILQGDIDQSASLEVHGRPTHELIAGSRFIVYENAAHGLPFTHTDRMLRDILAFVGA